MFLAIDGTDQLDNGIPQFREITKDDAGQHRLKVHLEVVEIAGAPRTMYVYTVPENIPGDSNTTAEVLHRTLKKEEIRRGGTLPPVLYLQMDNCSATNKNSYIIALLSWWIERGVFSTVFLSFLPVGHTHNGPDQIASIVSRAVKYKDVHTIADLHRLIRSSTHPSPVVEAIDQVADFKHLFNPDGNPNYTNARMNFQRGICTPRPPTEKSLENIIGQTSALHFRFTKDSDGHVTFQTKQTCRVKEWSFVSYPWNADYVTAEGVKPGPHSTNVSPTELTVAPSKPLTETRLAELTTYLDNCMHRMSPEDQATTKALLERTSTLRPRSTDLHLKDYGLFSRENELHDEVEDDAIDPSAIVGVPVRIRDKNAVLDCVSEQNSLRKGGKLTNFVFVDKLIAYKSFYNESVPDKDKKDFWIGKVIATYPVSKDNPEAKVQVRTYYSSGLSNKRGPFKIYKGNPKYMDVPVGDIYWCCEKTLTTQGLIQAGDMRKIDHGIAASLLPNPTLFAVIGGDAPAQEH